MKENKQWVGERIKLAVSEMGEGLFSLSRVYNEVVRIWPQDKLLPDLDKLKRHILVLLKNWTVEGYLLREGERGNYCYRLVEPLEPFKKKKTTKPRKLGGQRRLLKAILEMGAEPFTAPEISLKAGVDVTVACTTLLKLLASKVVERSGEPKKYLWRVVGKIPQPVVLRRVAKKTNSSQAPDSNLIEVTEDDILNVLEEARGPLRQREVVSKLADRIKWEGSRKRGTILYRQATETLNQLVASSKVRVSGSPKGGASRFYQFER